MAASRWRRRELRRCERAMPPLERTRAVSSQAGGYSMAAGQVSRGHVGAASASIPASMPMPMPMPTASATPQRVPGAPTLTPGARRRVPGAPGTGDRLQRRGSSQPAVQASTPARRVPGAPSPLRSKRLAKAQSSSTTVGAAFKCRRLPHRAAIRVAVQVQGLETSLRLQMGRIVGVYRDRTKHRKVQENALWQ